MLEGRCSCLFEQAKRVDKSLYIKQYENRNLQRPRRSGVQEQAG